MSLMRIQARLHNDSGIPADDAVNVWHFDSDQTFADDADDTCDRLEVFYQAIQTYLSTNLDGTIDFKVYDMEDPEPRVPKHEQSGVFVPAGGPLPNELAICLSFHAEQVAGIPQARRRGRVFLGPLSTNVMVDDAGDVRVAATPRADIAAAAAALAHGPDAGDARLAVYSPTTDILGSTADAFNDVVGGWVDDAFDVQRRRGAKPTTRTLWVPAQAVADGQVVADVVNAALNTLQVCFLAYLAAKYRVNGNGGARS